MIARLRRFAALASCVLGSACSAGVSGAGTPTASLTVGTSPASVTLQRIRTPAVVVITPNGMLRYYPVSPHGGRAPIGIAKVPGVHEAASMAADGRELAIADKGKAGVVIYDLKTKTAHAFADPYGAPIDVALDRKGNVYLLDGTGSAPSQVVMYPPHTRQPQPLSCQALVRGVAIAADDEGNLFVNGYDTQSAGVFEIPNGPDGPQPDRCKRLALLPESGYAAGIAVDPQTDDLIVVSDPGACSGGIEGQMTIYRKPYAQRTARSADLNGRCVGLVRLNGSSGEIFAFDRTSAFAHADVIGRSYPQGSGDATYRHKYVGGFTTLPNVLPN